jgi:hypothetical protein
MKDIDLKGTTPESWNCVDCGVNTAPGVLNRVELERAFKSQRLSASGNTSVNNTIGPQSEVYTVHDKVWKAAGMQPWGGCLCVGCLEKRLGRQLKPKDFPRNHPFFKMPGTLRLMSRRQDYAIINHADGLFANCGGNVTPVKTPDEAAQIIHDWRERRLRI